MTGRAGSMIRDGALWGGASVLVLALHLGGALWLMHRAEAGAPPRACRNPSSWTWPPPKSRPRKP
ncbi:hypothetical protein ACFSYD_04550 [Paracoccus aerius]